jgi:hypothetical protein
MALKYINTFQSKALKNLPKLVFLFGKQTIWQPWCRNFVIFLDFLGFTYIVKALAAS